MYLIYSQTAFTIISAAGNGPEYGLPGIQGTIRKHQPSLKLTGISLIPRPPHPRVSVEASTWNTRAWTLQEEVLSPQCVIFTDHQLLFECNQMYSVESERSPFEQSQFAATHHDRLWRGEDASPRVFSKPHIHDPVDVHAMISKYTSRELTYQEDALNAFAGIQRLFERMNCPLTFIMGIPILPSCYHETPWYRKYEVLDCISLARCPEESFLLGLTWYHKIAGTRRHEFPTWSWAGWREQAHHWEIGGVESLTTASVLFAAQDDTMVALLALPLRHQDVPDFLALLPTHLDYVYIKATAFDIPVSAFFQVDDGNSYVAFPVDDTHVYAPYYPDDSQAVPTSILAVSFLESNLPFWGHKSWLPFRTAIVLTERITKYEWKKEDRSEIYSLILLVLERNEDQYRRVGLINFRPGTVDDVPYHPQEHHLYIKAYWQLERSQKIIRLK
jgi:Heterokaryon incompatibility protein (HET)